MGEPPSRERETLILESSNMFSRTVVNSKTHLDTDFSSGALSIRQCRTRICSMVAIFVRGSCVACVNLVRGEYVCNSCGDALLVNDLPV